MAPANSQRPQGLPDGSLRSKTSTTTTSFINRRFSAISLTARGSASESSDDIRGPLGLNLLYEPSEPLIDFIFVHGLRGGSRKTWSKTEDPAHFWPKEWLPTEPRFKNVRIHSFGYSSDWGERKGSTITLHDFGQALLGDIHSTLCSSRDALVTPLVMIGHSMGGIVIKKVLLLARQDPLYHHIAARIHSMFFLATPHRGADSAQLLSNMLKVAVSHGPKAYVDSLIPNSDAIQVINDGFRHAYQGIQLWSFFETAKTTLGLIVEKDSSILDLPGERVQLLNADHRNVCKFDNPSDSNYGTLRNSFVATIDCIESTWYSNKKADHQQQMRLLSTYFGISQTPENDLANITEAQLDGSCTWLTEHSSFENWRSGLESHPKLLWLTGDPATGKSTLTGHVIKYLEQMNGDCSYFFFKHHCAGKSTVADLLCSFAWQMASTNTDIRKNLLLMHKDDVPIDRADERAIWRSVFVSRILRTQLRQPHFWIVDGVDECNSFTSFIPMLARIDAQFPLLVFVTSRPSLTMERALSHEHIPRYHEVLSRDRSLGDIALYVRSHSHYLPCECETVREELVHRIIQKSNGNFLWTRLVVRELEAAMSEQRIQETLNSVPQEIDDLYARIFKQLMASPSEGKLVATIFRWIVCTSRPLTVEELKDALRLDIGEVLPQLDKTVNSICGNLVFVDLQKRVRLAHHTVREYLNREDLPMDLTINKHEAHAQIARVCLDYMQGDEMKIARHRRGIAINKNRKRSAFSEYAIKHYSDHVARAASARESLVTGLQNFLQSTSLAWLELVATSQDLAPLTFSAKNLRLYLEQRAKYEAPISPHIRCIQEWANDLVRLVAQYGGAMIASPSSIAHLIPPICPKESALHQAFCDFYPRGLRIVGLSQRTWDDRLCCIEFSGAQALSVTCRDNRYALGLSTGYVNIYHETSFQEQMRLQHGEPVRQLAFGLLSQFVASAGRKRISLWDTSSGSQLWSASLTALPLALNFNEDDTIVMAATRANTLSFWEVNTGNELDVSQFTDINEEDQSEYHYNRPPIRIKFAPNLNLLGVAYRQRPISFWDLEDNTFVGQYHKIGAAYPEPLIHDFLFNPNPDICIAAVAYEGTNVAVFDPFTQHTIATLDVAVSSLAASPDGSMLATGSGDGIIKIFEFETLKLTYQVSSYQQDVRALAFNSNSLRILDLRSNQFNVWQPSILASRSKPSDDSSLNYSASVDEEPEYVATALYDDDHTVTAIAIHHDFGIIFCGREDGTVGIYSSATGQELQALFHHGLNLAIVMLEWNEPKNMLLAIDRSGGYSIQEITRDAQRHFHHKYILQKSGCQVQQALFCPSEDRLLVSAASQYELWNIDGTLISSSIFTDVSAHRKWIQHPNDPGILLLITGEQLQVFDWLNLQECSDAQGIYLENTATTMAPVTFLAATHRGQYLGIYCSGSRSLGLVPSLRLYPTIKIRKGETIKAAACFDDVAGDIKRIIGVHKSQLLYLNNQGWVCSLNIDDFSPEKFYTRHFFVPLQWHSSTENLSIRVTNKGCIILGVRNEIAVFHNGLNFEERVGCKGVIVSARASMRSVMKRGVSQP